MIVEIPFVVAPFLSSTSVTAIQTIVVGGLVFLGQYLVAKMSNKAQEKNTSVDSQSKATEAWQKYAEEMKTRLDSLESRLNEAERRVRALETQSARDLDLIRRLVYRLRAAITSITSLGGTVPEEDHELADLADLRLNIEPTSPERNTP